MGMGIWNRKDRLDSCSRVFASFAYTGIHMCICIVDVHLQPRIYMLSGKCLSADNHRRAGEICLRFPASARNPTQNWLTRKGWFPGSRKVQRGGCFNDSLEGKLPVSRALPVRDCNWLISWGSGIRNPSDPSWSVGMQPTYSRYQ